MLRDCETGGKVRTYIATADILYQARVEFRFLDNFLKERIQEEIELSVFESTLETFCEWCANRKGYNYIVGILGGTVDVGISTCFMTFDQVPTLRRVLKNQE